MKFFGFIYMTSGCVLAILVLRMVHGEWADFLGIAMCTVAINTFTVLLAILVFRKSSKDATLDRVLLIVCYMIGIGAGAYFYFT